MTHHDDDQHTRKRGSTALTFEEKGVKLLRYWIQHNSDHADNYRRWAMELSQHQLPEVAALLEAAAELTLQINFSLNEALDLLPNDEENR